MSKQDEESTTPADEEVTNSQSLDALNDQYQRLLKNYSSITEKFPQINNWIFDKHKNTTVKNPYLLKAKLEDTDAIEVYTTLVKPDRDAYTELQKGLETALNTGSLPYNNEVQVFNAAATNLLLAYRTSNTLDNEFAQATRNLVRSGLKPQDKLEVFEKLMGVSAKGLFNEDNSKKMSPRLSAHCVYAHRDIMLEGESIKKDKNANSNFQGSVKQAYNRLADVLANPKSEYIDDKISAAMSGVMEVLIYKDVDHKTRQNVLNNIGDIAKKYGVDGKVTTQLAEINKKFKEQLKYEPLDAQVRLAFHDVNKDLGIAFGPNKYDIMINVYKALRSDYKDCAKETAENNPEKTVKALRGEFAKFGRFWKGAHEVNKDKIDIVAKLINNLKDTTDPSFPEALKANLEKYKTELQDQVIGVDIDKAQEQFINANKKLLSVECTRDAVEKLFQAIKDHKEPNDTDVIKQSLERICENIHKAPGSCSDKQKMMDSLRDNIIQKAIVGRYKYNITDGTGVVDPIKQVINEHSKVYDNATKMFNRYDTQDGKEGLFSSIFKGNHSKLKNSLENVSTDIALMQSEKKIDQESFIKNLKDALKNPLITKGEDKLSIGAKQRNLYYQIRHQLDNAPTDNENIKSISKALTSDPDLKALNEKYKHPKNPKTMEATYNFSYKPQQAEGKKEAGVKPETNDEKSTGEENRGVQATQEGERQSMDQAVYDLRKLNEKLTYSVNNKKFWITENEAVTLVSVLCKFDGVGENIKNIPQEIKDAPISQEQFTDILKDPKIKEIMSTVFNSKTIKKGLDKSVQRDVDIGHKTPGAVTPHAKNILTFEGSIQKANKEVDIIKMKKSFITTDAERITYPQKGQNKIQEERNAKALGKV